MDEKVMKLEEKFLEFQQNLIKEALQKRDLDKAMGDALSANKEQIKLDMLSQSVKAFERVKNEERFEDVINGFVEWLEEEKEKRAQLISRAREQANQQEMIENQIRLSTLEGPVGVFKVFAKQVQA